MESFDLAVLALDAAAADYREAIKSAEPDCQVCERELSETRTAYIKARLNFDSFFRLNNDDLSNRVKNLENFIASYREGIGKLFNRLYTKLENAANSLRL